MGGPEAEFKERSVRVKQFRQSLANRHPTELPLPLLPRGSAALPENVGLFLEGLSELTQGDHGELRNREGLSHDAPRCE